jgi:hypothetical protein
LFAVETDGQYDHLTKGLFAARTPDLFHDGKRFVFSAKSDASDHWQIYSYDFREREYTKLFHLDHDCLDPVFLPNGDVLFSAAVEVAAGTLDLALFRWKQDGKMERITFTPYSFSQPLIMQDGRILALYAESPESNPESLMVMRPDGTKNSMFYKSPDGNVILGDLLQLENGSIGFLELNHRKRTRELVSISYNNPSNSRTVLHSEPLDLELALGIFDEGKLLLSKKDDSSNEIKRFILDVKTKVLDQVVMENATGIHGPSIRLQPVKRQKILPSAVKPEVQTALLMCQDVRINTDARTSEDNEAHGPIEVQGMDRSLGTIDLAADGSFYLKLKADTPFRFQRLDEQGDPIGTPSAWMSLRPNERRACIGCHVSNERVPDNVQPLAVRKEPLDLSAGEKKIMANRVD